MSPRTSLVVACVGILIGVCGALSGSWAYVRTSQGRLAQAPAVVAPDRAARIEPVVTPPSDVSPIARALTLADVASTSVRMIIPVRSSGYFIIASVASEAGENQVREWYIDIDTQKVTLIAQRFLGPAPRYTYSPYDLFTDQLHVQTIDAWEGMLITHDDYIDLKKGAVLAVIDVYANRATAVVSNAHASTTIDYVYDKSQCMTQKHDGKKVAVTGIRVNGTRTIAFTSPVQATCGYSEFSGEADLSIGFSSEGYRVNPEGMMIQVAGNHSAVIPLTSIGDANAVLLDP